MGLNYYKNGYFVSKHTPHYGTNEFVIVKFAYALGGAWFSQEDEYLLD